MERSIRLQGSTIPFLLRRDRRSRRVRVSVIPGGRVTVSAPRFVTLRVINEFLGEHAGWIVRTMERMRNVLPQPKIGSKELALCKKRTHSLVLDRLAHFNAMYGFSWKRITVRTQRSRWGSCSRKGNLNFNAKIALLPPRLADYVIVHELCHLKEFNHSAGFWDLVAKAIPDHKECRAKLRRASSFL